MSFLFTLLASVFFVYSEAIAMDAPIYTQPPSRFLNCYIEVTINRELVGVSFFKDVENNKPFAEYVARAGGVTTYFRHNYGRILKYLDGNPIMFEKETILPNGSRSSAHSLFTDDPPIVDIELRVLGSQPGIQFISSISEYGTNTGHIFVSVNCKN